jgi:DNA primase catalytic core
MARIPDSEIERLKKEISLERLVQGHGVLLNRRGKDLIGLCPFHKDTDPSLVVTADKNIWHCLGACQTGGSVIDWVMKVHKVSFRHAIEILRADEIPATLSQPVEVGTLPKLCAPVTITADEQELLKQVVKYYHQTLKKSPEALTYLKNRGITSGEIIERYQIGFANRTLGLRLPERNRKNGIEIRARLQNAGILRKESGHEHFNGSIVVPITDDQEIGRAHV